MSVDLDTRVEPRTFANDYRDRHPAFFRTARHFGTFGLIDAYQDAGDVAPGESENLLVGRTLSRGYCEADLGGGRYKAPFSKGSLFLGRRGTETRSSPTIRTGSKSCLFRGERCAISMWVRTCRQMPISARR